MRRIFSKKKIIQCKSTNNTSNNEDDWAFFSPLLRVVVARDALPEFLGGIFTPQKL